MSFSSAPSSEASGQELLAFGKALIALGNSEMSTLAKFSKIFKRMSKKMEDYEVDLTPGEKKLADVIFGVPPKMSSFPLLKLPDVPRIQILRELEDIEIVQLSILSEKMKRVVRSANYPIDTLLFHSSRFPGVVEVNHNFSVEIIKERPDDQQVFKVIGGMEMSLGSKDNEFEEHTIDFILPTGVDESSLEDFLVRHFMGVFPKIEYLAVNLYSGKLQDFCIWNVTKSIDYLYYFDLEKTKIPVETMKFIMEEINVGKLLEMDTPVEDGFRYSEGFKTDYVNIGVDVSWVDLDAVINSTSSDIRLVPYGEITRSQINSLLKMWISGERMENLTRLMLKGCNIMEGDDDDVFDGIKVQSHDDGSDKYIVKRSDGKLAEITLSEDEFIIEMIK